MAQLDAFGVAGTHDRVLRMRELAEQKCLTAKIEERVAAVELVAVERIFITRERAADRDARVQFYLPIGAVNPELVAALVDLVDHADRDRVQVRVETGNRRLEEELAGQRLEGVIAEALHLDGLQNDAGVVAIAGQDFDLLAVHDRVAGLEKVGAACAVGAHFGDDLAGGVVTRPSVGAHPIVLEMFAHAVEAAVVIAELLQFVRRLGQEIAVEQIRLPVVDADIEFAGRLRLEPLDRCVAVNRVELVRLDVAEEPFAGVLFRVIRRRQQIAAAHFALDEKGGTTGGGSVVAVDREVAQLGIERVARTERTKRARVEMADVDSAFDHAGGDERSQLWQKRNDRIGLDDAARDAHRALARLDRCGEQILRAAALDEDLCAGFARIEIIDQPLTKARFERQPGARSHRHAVRVL